MIDKFKSLNVQLTAIFFILLFAVPLCVSDPIVLSIFIYTFLYAFYAGSWNIIGRYAGQVSVGHAVYFGLGAYISVLLYIHYGITPWLGMIVGGVVAGFVAFLIGLVCFRLRGLFFIFATLASGEVMRVIFADPLREFTGGEQGISFVLGRSSLYRFQFVEKWPYYFIALFMMLMVLFLLHRIERSKLGYCLTAIREDQEGAESIGVDILRYKSIALMISAFSTALGGAFYVHFLGWIGVTDVFGLLVSIQPIIISWVGGPGIFGPVVGSFIVMPISMYLVLMVGGSARGLHEVLYAVTLIFVVMFMPDGVTGPLYRRVYSPLKKRLGPQATEEGF